MIAYSADPAALDQLALDHPFFVGWPNPPQPDTHVAILQRSSHRVVASNDGALVGFVTAMSDGVLSSFISLLEVTPEFQGRGIGTELVRRILLEIGPIYAVDVACDPDVMPFYERLGFVAAGGGAIRRYEAQSGRINRTE